MVESEYEKNVFINCPFDENYLPFFQAILCMANYDTTFIAQTDSTLYFYKFTQNCDSVWRSGQITLPYNPLNYIYSTNDRFLIIATPNNSIDLLYIPTQRNVKSYILQDSINSSYLADFENGFLSGDSSGSIKYFTRVMLVLLHKASIFTAL